MNSEIYWYITRDADEYVRDMFDRHYSRLHYKDGRKPKKFIGPGEYILLRTWNCDAIFAWKKFLDACIDKRTGKPQEGVNCAIFRNESKIQSSILIRQADAIADFCWPGERHYTYVDEKKTKSTNPGACFKFAGWRTCGKSKSGKVILER